MRTHSVAFGLVFAAVAACSASDDTAPTPGGGSSTLVPPGKADDYFSTAGQEYTISGDTFAVIEQTCLSQNADSPDAAKRCAFESITLKNFAIAWILNQYVSDKNDAKNQEWGGFTAMTRPESYEALDVSEAQGDGKFSYTFTSELSGPFDLLDRVPTTPCGDGERCFTLEVPVLPNSTLSKMESGNEWYRKAPFNAYDPATYTGEKESLELRIKPYPRSNDAYLEYDKLFSAEQLSKAGGVLKIGMFVGWDYYDARYDLQTAKEMYRWLTQTRGFQSPVGSYEELKIDSGDLTRTIQVNGKQVPVSVHLVHPGQGDPANPTFAAQMKAAMVKSFAERQVIIFEGHAGPQYGFALANWNATEAGELDDSELPGLNIPESFYQVVLASGCDTYMVADSLYLNPVKQGRVDLDVITTTSFSNAAGKGRTAKILIDAVSNQDLGGEMKPQMYGEMIRKLNQEYWMTPLYGVHGIDDNPRFNPFADFSKLCEPCSSHAQCGGFDSSCVDYGGGKKHCGTKCETDNDCPNGFTCFEIRDGDTITGTACAPASLSCQQPPTAPSVWVNEIHYDNAGADVNEGVELAGTAGADLTGYRLVFYNGAPTQRRVYKTVVLDSGTLPNQGGGFGTHWVAVNGIQNGGGDTAGEPDGVALVNSLGEVVQFLSYEGAFTPTNGPAAGVMSTDIGVFQSTTSPVGQSLSLTGSGKQYTAFTWQSGVNASPGQPNPGQQF